MLDDVYMCIINEEEDGSIRHDTKRRIGQVLRDGERVLELQDWIADATEVRRRQSVANNLAVRARGPRRATAGRPR